MKRLLLPIFVLLSFAASSQSWTQIAGRQRFGTGIGIPTKDTTSGLTADSSQILIRPADSSLYVKYKRTWQKVGAVSVDTTIISTRLWRQKGIDSVAALANTKLSGLSVISPLTTTGGVSPVLSMSPATSTSSGYLTSTDWNTFNNKVTSVSATAPIVSTGGTTPILSMTAATASSNGYLTSTDWTTFNNKQNAIVNPMTGTGTINYVPKFTSTSSIGNSQIFDNGTNVGIGTTSPAKKLDVLGSGRFNGTGFDAISAEVQLNNTTASTGRNFVLNSYDAGGFQIADKTAGSLTRFLIDNAGNVGIGTASPYGKLEVKGGNFYASSTNFNNSNTGGAIVMFQDNANYGTIWSLKNGNTAWGDVAIAPSGGNVGIGTTSPISGNKLQVDGGYISVRGVVGGGGGFYLSHPNTTNASARTWGFGASISSFGDFGINQSNAKDGDPITAGTNRFYIDASGNVGIGTTSPSALLQVDKSASAGLGGQIALKNSATSALNNSVEISFLTDAGASGTGTRNARIRAVNENVGNGAANMQFWTWNGSTDAERMRITSGGNVLIGTTTDNGTDKLQVNGSATINNQFQITGNGTKINWFSSGFENWYAGTRTSSTQFSIGSQTTPDALILNNNGSAQFTSSVTASGTATAATIVKSGGTSSQALMANGSVQTVTSGTYTPTLTNNNGTAGLTTQAATYTRIGNIVTVYFYVSGTCTSSLTNIFFISIPVGNNFTSTLQAQGTSFSGTNNLSGAISAAASTQWVSVSFAVPASVNTFDMKGSFQYQVQ